MFSDWISELWQVEEQLAAEREARQADASAVEQLHKRLAAAEAAASAASDAQVSCNMPETCIIPRTGAWVIFRHGSGEGFAMPAPAI